MYNGMFAAAAGSAPGAALFFSTYETAKSELTERFHPAYHPACYMASSAFGEVAACWIRVPTENIKQKMQAGMYNNTTECFRAIARSGRRGSGFYKGYTATVSREIPFSFIQFPIYETLKKQWSEWQDSEVTPIQSAVCGSIGEREQARARARVPVCVVWSWSLSSLPHAQEQLLPQHACPSTHTHASPKTAIHKRAHSLAGACA